MFKPSLVSWNLTKRCNLKCPHCYMEAGRSNGQNELDTAECLGLIDQMVSLGTEMIILTGGEPLLRRDIYEIAGYASQKGIWVVMGTNGVLLTDRVAKKMLECGIQGVGISLDSITPALHNSFRGGPNAWEHSVRAIEICHEHGLQVLIQTTVMDMNYHEIADLMAFALEKGAWSFNLYFLVQTGRGQQMNDLTPQLTHQMLEYMVDHQNDYRPMLVRSKCAPQFKQIAYEKGQGGLESGGCMAGTSYCRIMPEGDVTPCPYMTAVAGNVRQESFTDIWNHAPMFSQLRDLDQLKGRCGECEFKQICGGCRCRAYAASGDYLQEDPACTYQPTGKKIVQPVIKWDAPARERLDRIPIAFIRQKVQKGLEAYAASLGIHVITTDVYQNGLNGADRPKIFDNKPTFNKPSTTNGESK